MKHRLSMAGIVLFVAVALSAMAPQPSEANGYRIMVFTIVMLLVVARALTMGIWIGQSVDGGYTTTDNNTSYVSHSLSIRPREFNSP
ncbi:MAG: hypothetical protein QF878_06745 [SAR202 cluster bacterium]|nr:hypothetical protein [SAR202 cluster bacterium]MDP6716849.1 hypothetical protein [SAR202 cluster bacterium]